MRVFVIDDEPIVCSGLQVALATEPDLSVVGDAASAREAFPLLERTKPDLVICDLVLPGMDGIAATREIRHRMPSAQVLILTIHERVSDALEALSAGARGFALKTEPLSTLRSAIRAVARGERYLTPSLRHLVEGPDQVHGTDILSPLSTREREVFQLVASGLRIADIARELCISRKTVETHVCRIYRKIGCGNVADLVRFAARHGLLRFVETRASIDYGAAGLGDGHASP